MNNEKFGKFISDRRKELKMTQSDLAKKLNVTSKAVSRWERGVGLPDINTIAPLAKALNLSIVEVMTSEIKDNKIDKKEVSNILQHSLMTTKENEKELKSIIIFLMIYFTIVLIEIFIRSISYDKESMLLTFKFPLEIAPLSILLIIYGLIRCIQGKPYKQTIAICLIMPIIVTIILASVFLILSIIN